MTDNNGFKKYEGLLQGKAQMALDTINMLETKGIPSFCINVMQWSHLDKISGNPPGSYQKDPKRVYLEFSKKAGVCMIDQWIPDNPLSMKDQGYDSATKKGASTGAEEIILDGIHIDSPEAVIEHLEKYVFPKWQKWKLQLQNNFDNEVIDRIKAEVSVQELFGMDMLKVPYSGFFAFPGFLYGQYGYVNYFMAYALYPEVIEKGFDIMADACTVFNRIAAKAIIDGSLPRLIRLDHDMADSRGLLVDVKTLDKMWFPHFTRSIKPLLDAGIRLIWHCDGNLMALIPGLLEAGIGGFQGFQYEDGMDYEKICKMKTKDGDDLFIVAGISVTTTLPLKKPDDVRKEMKWLVDNGPKRGLMLACSSSIAPGVPIENILTLLEGFEYYQKGGR